MGDLNLNVCRCCLSEGQLKDLNTSYTWKNNKEVYAAMLHECFNIVLSSAQYNNICEACVDELRLSLKFKQQILKNEQEFLNRLTKSENEDQKPVYIKLEPKEDSDADESDDYFLVEIASKNSIENIKEEPLEALEMKPKLKKEKISKKIAKTKTNRWQRKDKIRNLVTKLTTSVNSYDIADITALNKQELSEIVKTDKKLTINKDRNMEIIWKSKSTIEKRKHKDNLITILKFSNAIPFKNDSLRGYICGYCEDTFPDPTDLRSHTEDEHKDERLSLKVTFDLTEYSVKVDITNLICTICNTNMENLNELKQHLIKTHKKIVHTDIKDHILQFKLKLGDVYDCTFCSATYETFKMLKQHMNNHYSNYSCNKCEASFVTKRSLNSHKARHAEGSFKCDLCDKVFSSKVKKNYHEKTKHRGTRSISKCQYCNESFRSYYQRNLHLVKVHNSEAKYKCNVCEKSYVLKSLLMCHVKKNHLMERNFQCTECGFRFFNRKALKAHMVKHTGERKYICEVCHKSYARKYTLREHLRIHNNDRRFKCEVCGMSFVQKCSLKSHLLSNHGISMAAVDITSS